MYPPTSTYPHDIEPAVPDRNAVPSRHLSGASSLHEADVVLKFMCYYSHVLMHADAPAVTQHRT